MIEASLNSTAIGRPLPRAEQFSLPRGARGEKRSKGRVLRVGEQAVRTIVAVPGSWHDAAAFNLVRPLFNDAGYNFVTINLDLDRRGASLDAHAKTVARSIRGFDDIEMLLGHSMSGDVVPRVPEKSRRTRIRSLGFVASAFRPSTVMRKPDIRRMPEEELPTRNTPEFLAGIECFDRRDPNRSRFRSELAGEVFYNDCLDQLTAAEAIANLRPQRLGARQRVLGQWPGDITSHYILCADDRAVYPDWQQHVAENILRTEPQALNCGHVPFVSQPEIFTAQVLSLIESPRTRSR